MPPRPTSWRARAVSEARSVFRLYLILRRIWGLSKLAVVPGGNFADPEFQTEWDRRYEEDVKSWKITPVGSWECDYKRHSDTLTNCKVSVVCVGRAGAEPMLRRTLAMDVDEAILIEADASWDIH